MRPDFYKGKEKNKPIKASSDSEEFSSPAILKNHSQFRTKKMKAMSEEIITPEHMFRTKMDLKLPGKTQPVFKSVWKRKKRKTFRLVRIESFRFHCLVPSQERISAFDGSTRNSNIVINTNISSSMLGIMGAEEGVTSRNLRP